MKRQQVLMAGGFFSGCSQVILKASVSKLIQCPCQCERSPPIMDLALKRIPLPRVSASDPSPLGEILRNSWKKTGIQPNLEKTIVDWVAEMILFVGHGLNSHPG